MEEEMKLYKFLTWWYNHFVAIFWIAIPFAVVLGIRGAFGPWYDALYAAVSVVFLLFVWAPAILHPLLLPAELPFRLRMRLHVPVLYPSGLVQIILAMLLPAGVIYAIQHNHIGWAIVCGVIFLASLVFFAWLCWRTRKKPTH